jgi:hypothetical protein
VDAFISNVRYSWEDQSVEISGFSSLTAHLFSDRVPSKFTINEGSLWEQEVLRIKMKRIPDKGNDI